LKPSPANGKLTPAVLSRRFIVPLIQIYLEFTTWSRVLIIGNDIRAVLLVVETCHRLRSEIALDDNPSWSPDGKRLACGFFDQINPLSALRAWPIH
jgi:hypothetical protein